MRKILSDNIKRLITTLDNSNITKFYFKNANLELVVNKEKNFFSKFFPLSSSVSNMKENPTASTNRPFLDSIDTVDKKNVISNANSDFNNDLRNDFIDIKSPMAGTFYESSSPGEAPLVKVGTKVGTNQVLCIIEAMKLMNEIEAEIDGEVNEIFVKNGELVDYGKPLMRIKPL
nr:acetyl-CoA carboxylase biotin carboxyl carrier protein [Cavernulicola chilensis]